MASFGEFKSLTDSSTSESEEDLNQKKKVPYEPWSSIKRKFSTEDTEDELLSPNRSRVFKNPSHFIERGHSTDEAEESSQPSFKRSFSTEDTEDEHAEDQELPNKMFKSSHFVEREISDSESDGSSPLKNISSNNVAPAVNGNYGVGMKLMEKMGYKSGTGLGKYEQGRVEIVEASKQRGRRGLGLHITGLEPSDSVWDSSKDQVSLKEDILWMPKCRSEPPDKTTLRNWMREDTKKENIDDEEEFCDPDILKNVLVFKSVFDELEPDEMRKARTRANPFETIRGVIFLNRAAVKMANMDAAFDFMFTNPKNMNGEPMVQGNELLYFADICAGPGGFSEYVLWRKKWDCKGFGFTLKGANDFKLEDFFAGSPETFETYYGIKDDGNIYTPENLEDFKKFVLENTDGKGVHFVMADGGFSVEGRENEQEILSKRLYLCQFLCALLILRTGGHFVCKLFDLFTPFSVGLVYLMYHAFEKVCIFKPNTSRPANSERYIICKWRKENIHTIADYMFYVNCFIDKQCGAVSNQDVREVVPLEVLKEDEDFYDYIVKSNNLIGSRQIIHLDKIRAFAQNTQLNDERQNELRKQCLELWQIPDKARSAPSRPDPGARFKELMQGENLSYLKSSPELLTAKNLKQLESIFDFHCVVCGETKQDQPPSLFLGLGRSNIYHYDTKNMKWNKIEITLELPADTVFYGELILELKGDGRGQKKITCLHLIDVIYLGGKDVRKKHFVERMQLAEKLSKAVTKQSRKSFTLLRVKKFWELQHIEEVFDRLHPKINKNCSVPRLCFDVGDGRHIIPSGLLIFKTTADPWVTAFSKTNQKHYLFDTKKNRSLFGRVPEANASFQFCYSKRILWIWDQEVQLKPDERVKNYENNVVHSISLITFVMKNLNRITQRPS